MDERVHVLGIRHHGPGSAASVLSALEALGPSCVLIEGPPEADALIPLAVVPGMRPPLAILTWATGDVELARFHPFAEYSPEWCAMRWAIGQGVPARFIDLPTEVVPPAEDVAEVPDEAGGAPEGAGDTPEKAGDLSEDADVVDAELDVDPAEEIRRDPLTHLARIAGHSDGESWWSTLVEQHVHSPDVFIAIHDAMAALREAAEREPSGAGATGEADGASPPAAGDRDDERREAFMRQQIRAALKASEGAIAVVCGAWHAPALTATVPLAQDRATLKGFKKAKTESCWVPWTDRRLALRSGYGAGVVAPGWYRHLWQQFEDGRSAIDGVARWQTRVAQHLRSAGHTAATASVIDATRLATTLAALRGRPVPGQSEMRDASLATLCHGEPAFLRVIEDELMIGERVGHVDESVPQPPLQADLARWQKRLRLKPEAVEKEIAVDLRTSAGMAKSELLHRLNLIDVAWGTLVDASAGRGTFREVWRLLWEPELSVKLAEALIWGHTIQHAATQRAASIAEEERDAARLAEVVRGCLLANLPDAAEAGIRALQAVAVSSGDLPGLMPAVSPLTDILRYGTARELPIDALRKLVEGIVIEVAAGLVYVCRGLDAEQAESMRAAIAGFDRSVDQLESEYLAGQWHGALHAVCSDARCAPGVCGLAQRLRYDKGLEDAETTAAALSRALSPSIPPAEAGAWLEGFLGQSGDVLLHDAALLGCVDAWIVGQGEEPFVELLPMLRRAFSNLDATLRSRLLDQLLGARADARGLVVVESDSRADRAFERARPLLERILGLAPAAPEVTQQEGHDG